MLVFATIRSSGVPGSGKVAAGSSPCSRAATMEVPPVFMMWVKNTRRPRTGG